MKCHLIESYAKKDAKSNHYVLDSLYEQFQNAKDEYWIKHVAFNPIINIDIKHLIIEMLRYDPQNRISIQDIINQHKLQNIDLNSQLDTSLQHNIESLTKQRKNDFHDIDGYS